MLYLSIDFIAQNWLLQLCKIDVIPDCQILFCNHFHFSNNATWHCCMSFDLHVRWYHFSFHMIVIRANWRHSDCQNTLQSFSFSCLNICNQTQMQIWYYFSFVSQRNVTLSHVSWLTIQIDVIFLFMWLYVTQIESIPVKIRYNHFHLSHLCNEIHINWDFF